jgi:multidrug efflux pump subunit AcrA (membrane-fusion protein)
MRHTFLYVFLIGLIGTACQKKQSSVHPMERDLVEVVYASGNLYPQSEYKVFANVTGSITDVAVSEGDKISKGVLLATIDGPNRDSERETNASLFAITNENRAPILAQLKERAEALRIKAANDSLTALRYRNLADQGAVALAEVDRVNTLWEQSKRDYRALKAQMEAQENSLKADLAQSKNRLNQATNNLKDGQLRSFMDGIVYELYKEKGDYVHQNEAVALLGDGGKPIARLSIDESDIFRVKTGQKVLITFDAFGDRVFTAHVRKIYPKLNKTEQTVRVDADFEGDLPSNVYGLNLEANIIIQEKNKALCIPREYLLPGDSVYIDKDGSTKAMKVTTGAQDMNYVEVKTGLQRDDVLTKKP